MASTILCPGMCCPENTKTTKESLVQSNITNVIMGPLSDLSLTVSTMLNFMTLKASTAEDHLMIKLISGKILSEFKAIIIGLLSPIYPDIDINNIVEDYIKKYIEQLKAARDQIVPKDESL